MGQIGLLARAIGLPGELSLRIGTAGDYHGLARFHYVQRRPASMALVLAVDYAEVGVRRTVGVGVLSYPPLSCRAREEALRMARTSAELRWEVVNRHVRTISRVIVHPQFRGIGLAGELARALIARCPTRYTEAISRLGQHHGLFAAAGMVRFGGGYFLRDGWASCRAGSVSPPFAA